MNKIFTAQVIKAGLLVGVLDILAALVRQYIKTGKSPVGILKFIASGIFGQAAFANGDIMILVGLVLHLGIAMLFTLFFFWLVRKLPFLLTYKVLTGIAYGIFIWCVMQFMVLPLSNTTKLPFAVKDAIISMSILVVCIGLPLVFMMGKTVRMNKS